MTRLPAKPFPVHYFSEDQPTRVAAPVGPPSQSVMMSSRAGLGGSHGRTNLQLHRIITKTCPVSARRRTPATSTVYSGAGIDKVLGLQG